MISTLLEIAAFILRSRKFWLIPIFIIFGLFGALIVLSSGSAVTPPFIYTLFLMKILGISCFYHDSAATLIVDGEIVAAVREERFTRIKNDPSFPLNSIKILFKSREIGLSELDHIVFYETLN